MSWQLRRPPKLMRRLLLMGVCAVGLAPLAPAPAFAQALDRRVLPIAEPKWEPITTLDARDAKAPPRFEVKAPEKAPNVVIVLLDDMGFGQPGAFGGPIAMPVLDRLAKEGVRFNRFHTTALCSPSRVALLTGHNHHANNAGAIIVW
jgi:arylsulfatase